MVAKATAHLVTDSATRKGPAAETSVQGIFILDMDQVGKTQRQVQTTKDPANLTNVTQGSTVDTFRILLHGAKYEKPFTPITTPVLGIPVPDQQAKIDINPIDVEFPKGKMKTAWKTFAMNNITLGPELNTDQDLRLQARWRIRAANNNGTLNYRLVLETLTIPITYHAVTSMDTATREVAESLGAPVVVGKPTQRNGRPIRLRTLGNAQQQRRATQT